tara:strand:+ start:251 stop:514 length:264 start_codon:yes stop_codon:yes gene_type:complete
MITDHLFGTKETTKYYPLTEIKIYDYGNIPKKNIEIRKDNKAQAIIQKWLNSPGIKNECIWVNRVYKYRNEDSEYYQEYLFVNYLDV